MKTITKTILAGALALGTAISTTSASAVTLVDNTGVLQGVGSVNSSNDFTTLDVDFNWTATPFTGFLNFTITALADLTLVDYVVTAGGTPSDVSGFTLDKLDTINGSATSRLTNVTSFCGGAAAPIAGTAGDCNLVTGLTQSGANPDSAARPGDVLFTSLAIGSYRLGLYDSATPTAGTASFEIGTAVVPLPAAAWLFGSALLGLGALKRKKA